MSGAAAPMSTFAAIYSSRAWRLSLSIVAALAGVFLLYRPSSESLIALWDDIARITYTHGFLIAAISAWLVVRRRRELADEPCAPSVAGAAVTVLTGVVWFFAVRAGIEIVNQVLLVILMWLSVWALFGLRVARVIWLPVGFLLFAVPVWDIVNPLLQELTVHAVHALLQVAGIPAYVDGNYVHVAAGVFEVAGGCSGIHFFIVSFSLGTLYGEIGRDPWKVRAWLLALAVGFALLANWVRVFIIVVAGHLTNMQHYLIREEHYNFGWAVFAVMMLFYLILARRIAPPARNEPPPLAELGNGAKGTRATGLLVAIGCVALIPVFEILNPVKPAPLPALGASLPPVPAGWSQATSHTMSWSPVFAGADQEERSEYADDNGQHLAVFVATYAMQRQNKELIAYGNSLIGSNEGPVVSNTRADSGEPAQEIVFEHGNQRSLIRYYYRVGDRRTARGVVAQLWYGFRAMTGATTSQVVAMRAPCVPDCNSARKLLNEFSGQ
jgi:exosortase A